MYNAHIITKQFERSVCEYTGAPYCVAVNSCTMAILLAVAWVLRNTEYPARTVYVGADHMGSRPAVEIPKHTYVGVPQSITHAGGRPTFRDEDWTGAYQLKPLHVYDSARHFSGGMYEQGFFWGSRAPFLYRLERAMVCVSFHTSKILGDTQGGAILHDSQEADAWLRRARFDGRTEGVAPKDDKFTFAGWHAYLSPDVAARLLWKLSVLPRHNEPLPNDAYPDLSQMECFK